MVPQDRNCVRAARVLSFTGHKKIGTMLVEAAEDGAVANLANLQGKDRYTNANRT